MVLTSALLLVCLWESHSVRLRRSGGSPAASGSWVHSSPFPGAGFRGTFRDLSLWIDPPGSASIHSDAGNDLWVVEYNDAGQMATERRRAEKSEVSLILEEKFSLVLQGDVPGVMGYDACGSEANMTVISVPDHDIVERPMPVATASKRLTEAADPAIEELLQQMSEDDIVATITQLQSYNSRNSASGGANLDAAAEWAAGELTRYGGWTVTRDNYRSDYTPQIIAEMVGAVDPNKVVVMGAHLDSTASRSSSSISARAPGADDNGSGSASVMAFAKAVASTNTRFRHTIRLCLFTGEEQGLRGSRDLARRWSSDGVNIIGMINTDMIGYRQSGAPITVNFMNRYVSSSMTNIAKAATGTYLPGVGVGDTAVCCSDQQSFHENGFPAVSFFETTPSSVVYPQYHTSSDLLQNFDSAVVVVQGKAAWATLAVMAEIDDGSTPQPTPAPAPGTWELSGSGCVMVGDCVQSLNHPSNYGNNQNCEVQLNGDFALTVEAFNTESRYDFLTMGGTSYSGSSGPSSGTYTGVISWATDYSVVSSGWKVCKA